MPCLASAPAWQTDIAFTEIFASSANKAYERNAEAGSPRYKSRNDRASGWAIANIVHRSHNYQEEEVPGGGSR